MHEEINELLAGYTLGDLSELETFRVNKHLAECKQCNSELERIEGLLEYARQMRELSADEYLCKSAKESLFATIESEKIKTKTDRPKTGEVIIQKTIINNKIAASAIAAVIIIGILLVVSFIDKPDVPGVAWGNLVERVEKINFYKYKRQTISTGIHGVVFYEKADVYRSLAHGFRIDQYLPVINYKIIDYGSLLDKTYMRVFPKIKKYVRVFLTEKQAQGMRDSNDFVNFIKILMSFQYTNLGSKIIDGKKVEGIEVNDPKILKWAFENCVARVWVDVETNLPVLYELEGTAGREIIQTKTVLYNFEWNGELDASVFEPNTSEYSLVAEVDSMPTSEETAVQALRRFSEITDGRYPSSLTRMNIKREIFMAYKEKMGKGIFFWEEEDFDWVGYSLLSSHLEITSMFYSELVNKDKDVVYYGKTVTANDSNSPLMRWKISDDEYRIIFGDLSIKNVSSVQLAELESHLNK